MRQGQRQARSAILCMFLVFALGHLVLVDHKSFAADVDQKWSFNFQSIPVTQAFNEITRATGIKIVAPSIPGNKTIRKTYTNKTIVYIVRDILKGVNQGLIWMSEKSDSKLTVWLADVNGKSGAKGAFGGASGMAGRSRSNPAYGDNGMQGPVMDDPPSMEPAEPPVYEEPDNGNQGGRRQPPVNRGAGGGMPPQDSDEYMPPQPLIEEPQYE